MGPEHRHARRATARLAGLILAGCAAGQARAQDSRFQDWPSFNRTLTSERYAPLGEVNRANVSGLKPICAYDLGIQTSFQSGLIVVGRTLYATTEKDILALDADDCSLRWRTHEPAADHPNRVNRGAAYLDGRLFRGMQDGRVIAYDAASGAKVWETRIGDGAMNEAVPAAPIVWKGLVFVGNAGGDFQGVKGRMYALEAATGKIVWQTYLVPKTAGDTGMPGAPDIGRSWGNDAKDPITGGGTWSSYTLDPVTGRLYISAGNPAPDFDASVRPGDNLFTNTVIVLDARTGAYRTHYPVIPKDWHDWDVAATPSLFRTRKGTQIVSVTPKDGYLYAFDAKSGARLYKTAVTTIENADTPFSQAPSRFCPGTSGGAVWNGPAYSPQTNLVFTGAVDWCTILRLSPDAAKTIAPGKSWTGAENNRYGDKDGPGQGWITAVDADTGAVRWNFKTANVQLSGLTPTAGGLLFFGNGDGKAYALDQKTGAVLWTGNLGAASGGGVITYAVGGKQRIAFAAGMDKRWPTADQNPARIVVWGLR